MTLATGKFFVGVGRLHKADRMRAGESERLSVERLGLASVYTDL